ncbi:MAG: RHS repeat-associated core domain-containing protein, partial [Actinomycetota bacterium]
PYRDGFPFLHVGARYYDPSSGRFLQRDPIGIRGGTNVYSYAGNTPTAAVDPDGELIWFVIIAAVAVIVIDSGAEYANAPAPGDPVYTGAAGPSPVSVYAGAVLVGGLAGGGARAVPVGGGGPRGDVEWRGSGPPESGKGGYYNPRTNESWHPDFDHGPPDGPHWDYTDPTGRKFREYPDGRRIPKSSMSCL